MDGRWGGAFPGGGYRQRRWSSGDKARRRCSGGARLPGRRGERGGLDRWALVDQGEVVESDGWLVRRKRRLLDRIWEDPEVDAGGCRWRQLEWTNPLEFRVWSTNRHGGLYIVKQIILGQIGPSDHNRLGDSNEKTMILYRCLGMICVQR